VGTEGFRDFVLERSAALHGWLSCKRHFKVNSANLPDFFGRERPDFAPPKKLVLRKYCEIKIKILKDAENWRRWVRKAAQG
jgi:hypothetical protein